MQDHKQLVVWQLAHDLTIRLHLITRKVSARAAPGLVPQLLRASASVPANIAEGCGQDTSAQFARFLTIAIASASEVENHVALAVGLGLFADAPAAELTADVQRLRRMTYTLRKRVLARASAPSVPALPDTAHRVPGTPATPSS